MNTDGETPAPLAPPDGLLDIAANRASRKWSAAEFAGRALWETIGAAAFRLSPRPLWAWRRLVLRLFGARIGAHVHLHPTVRIAVPWNLDIGDYAAVGDGAILYSLGRISVGARATISQYAHLCAGTHDHRRSDFPLVKAPIVIGEGAWICADAYVGPSVEIGALAIVGARAVAIRDIPPSMIAAGNPAEPRRPRPTPHAPDTRRT